LHQRDGQLELGAEAPRVMLDELGQVLGTDIEQSTQRQSQRVPGRMPSQPGQADPNMAIDELLAGRTRRGVVVNAGTLHARAVACRGRVVDGEPQRAWA